MRDGIFACAPVIRIRTLCRIQSSPESTIVLRILVALAAAAMSWKRILLAMPLIPLAIPEREAAMRTEMLGICRNERRITLSGSHDYT
jgi:hypothetical protein